MYSINNSALLRSVHTLYHGGDGSELLQPILLQRSYSRLTPSPDMKWLASSGLIILRLLSVLTMIPARTYLAQVREDDRALPL